MDYYKPEKDENIFQKIVTSINTELNSKASLDKINNFLSENQIIQYNGDAIISSGKPVTYEEIKDFIDQYGLIIADIIKFNIINDNTSFEDDIIKFYTAIQEIEVDTTNPIYVCIHKLFSGICLYFMPNKKNEAFYELSVFKYWSNIFNIHFINDFTDQLLNSLIVYNGKERILVLVSPDNDKEYEILERPLIDNIVISKIDIFNYIVDYKIATNYRDINSILIETIAYNYVFFLGHGNQYFNFNVGEKTEKLKVETIINFYLSVSKRPNLLAVLSCAHDAYLPIAYSGLFDNFIISVNSGFEHSETFLKGFMYALDMTKNVENSLVVGRLALMCRFHGSNQIEIYRKRNNE